MKITLSCLGALVAWLLAGCGSPSGSSTAGMRAEVVSGLIGATGPFSDPVRGLSAVCPPGWTITRAARWAGDSTQTTIGFAAPNVQQGTIISLYYRVSPEPQLPPAEMETYLREEAHKKADQRIKSGMSDYAIRPETYTFGTLNGYPTLRFAADYTSREGEKCIEYNTRVMTPNGTALFFMMGNELMVRALKPEFDALMASLQLDFK